jgi:tRNA-2-methylthio-N6-dimethylallyladenosine synthase
MERLHIVEELQEGIAAEINARLQDTVQEVLVEGEKGGKLNGRTRSDKIVHFSGQARPGELANVRIEKTSAWSLQGQQVRRPTPVGSTDGR